MCGIAGIVNASMPVDEGLIEAMCAAQQHRGPDSRGVYLGAGAGLGIQRLRVIDLETGDQPIYNEERSVVVVLNGEIYNYRELREELLQRGHEFYTHGDTEVIVHLYEELGEGCVERLDGMFAFALWDVERQRLLLARDRVGKKPLYWCRRGAELSFASELVALTANHRVPTELDPSSLDSYLAFGYIQAPHSIWRGVNKLPPGHVLTWERGQVATERYWRLDYGYKRSADLPELEGELRSRIADAVRARMVADVPLGAFLSGGIDSSVVVSELAFQSAQPVKTFSIGFEEDDYNELPLARAVAKRFATDHTEFTVRPAAVDLLPQLVRHYGEPYADSSAIPSFYLAELTSRHVTVALNGDGGDESFAGYLRYPANAHTSWIDRVPRGLRAGIASGTAGWSDSREQRGVRTYARRYLKTLAETAPERYAAHVGIFDPEQRARLLRSDVGAEVDPRRTADVVGEPFLTATGRDRLDALLQVDVESYLPGDLLTKVDIATMAHGLEARSPLLDHRLMEFAASLPTRYKVRGTTRKWILRRAYRDIIPAQVLSAPKRGFAVPLGRWLRDELREWTRETLLDAETGGELLDRREVEAIVDRHQSGRGDHSAQIWSLLCFEEWRRQFLAR